MKLFGLSELRIQLVVNISGILISGLQWIRNSVVTSEGLRIHPFLVVSLASLPIAIFIQKFVKITIGNNVKETTQTFILKLQP